MLPGIGLLTIVGLAGKVLEKSIATYTKAHHLVVPNIEYVLWAIIGLLISNTIGVAEVLSRESRLMNSGSRPALCYWARTSSWRMFKVGRGKSHAGLDRIILSIGFMTLLGRILRLSPKLTSLLAVGSSICGVSAIIATRGAIEAMMKILHSPLRRSWLWVRWRYLPFLQLHGWE